MISMKMTKAYSENIKNKIITRDMLIDCLYSVNKRAKNARDQANSIVQKKRINRYFIDKYHAKENYIVMKKEYYGMKECMLKLFEPTCIHAEKNKIERIYDYEEKYSNIKETDALWYGSYYDYDEDREVFFIDVLLPDAVRQYYLFYDLGRHTFHIPIAKVEDYPELEIIPVCQIKTKGSNIEDLVSVQFVRKVINLIESGNYTLV